MFDIIFAGGETTACVIAGRLSASDPSLKILVIESGWHSHDVPSHIYPCRHPEHLVPGSTTISFHAGKPSSHLNGRAPIVPCGRGVGGGSTVNLMFYVRGAASDYDDWEALGNEGWSFKEVLPLIRKLEMFTPMLNQPTHGYSGPIRVSFSGTDLSVGTQFLNVARGYDSSRLQVVDANNFSTADAYSPSYRYVDPVTGRRSDAASGYLYPQLANLNVEVIVGAYVKRVVVENGRAVGVEYIRDKPGEIQDAIRANANKLVVISAGAFGSPSILERSGIGSRSILEKNSIRVLVDLPGVGKNYRDHLGICPVYHASSEVQTMDDIWSDPEIINAHLKEWEEHGTGKIAHIGIEAMAKVRLTSTELISAGSALLVRWKSFFEPKPDKPMAMIAPFAGFPWAPNQKSLSAIYYLLYPESIGSTHITSSKDVHSPLDFEPNFYSKESDVELLTVLYKFTRELIRRMPADRGEVAAYHPKFLPDSPAACRETNDPVPIDAPNIIYSDADNEAIVNFHRDVIATTCHSLGTCAMKPRDQDGVVDPRLNVYGVQNLKVADLSICPTNVGNNTCSTALLIGEKAAVIIAEEMGIKLHDT